MNFSRYIHSVLVVSQLHMCIANSQSVAAQVGQLAPMFETQAYVDGDIVDHFCSNDFLGRYKILLFYPLDFTFVCPTELHAFQDRLKDFTDRNAMIFAISVDSVHAHRAWAQIPKNMGGIEGVQYPLVSDLSKKISMDYGVLSNEGIALRGVFIIDDENIIQCMMINNLPLGRNVNEVLRLLDAVQHTKQSGMVCPANWTAHQHDMAPTVEGVQEYFQRCPESFYTACLDWMN